MQSVVRIEFRILTLLLLLITPLISAQETEQGEVAQLVAGYRRARTKAETKTEIALKLAAISDDAVANLGSIIEKELDSFGKKLTKTETKSQIEDEITKLRKSSADLRADAKLTEEKIRQAGTPALEQLKAIFPRWYAESQKQNAKNASTLKQLAVLHESCSQLKAAWKDSKEPLPVSEYLERIDNLQSGAAVSDLEVRSVEVLEINAKLAKKMQRSVAEGVTTFNQLRIMLGLVPLEVDPKLCEAAWGHSNDMQTYNFFAHESPIKGKSSPNDRAKQAGTTASGENIYVGSKSGNKSIEAWFYSPGHHVNMFGNHRRVGLGNAGLHWTMLFGR